MEGMAFKALVKARDLRKSVETTADPWTLTSFALSTFSEFQFLYLELSGLGRAAGNFIAKKAALRAINKGKQSGVTRRREIVARLANAGRTRSKARSVQTIAETIFAAVQAELKNHDSKAGLRTIVNDVNALRKSGVIKN